MNPTRIKDRLTVYKQIMRIDQPIGIFLLLWPTLWALMIAGQGRPDPMIVLIFVIGTFLMRSAGCVINDYADRNFDGHVARTRHRPFARGVISTQEAVRLAAGLALLSLLLILPLNSLTLALSLPALFVAASYPFTKRFFPMPQAYLGVAFSFGIPMAFAAQTGKVPALAWLLVLANSFWTLAYDTIYALSDRTDDLKIGIKTSAITFGDCAVLAIMLCHGTFLVLMTGIGLHLEMAWPFYLSLLVATGLTAQQYVKIREQEPSACVNAFLSNNSIGAAILAGIMLSYWLA